MLTVEAPFSRIAEATASVLGAAGILFNATRIMTTFQKLGPVTLLGLAVGISLFLGRQLWLEKDRSHQLRERLESLQTENRDLRSQRDEAVKHLAEASAEIQSMRSLATAGNPEFESALEGWLNRVQALTKWLEKMPEKRIPQMKLLTEEDWLEAAKNAKVDTPLGAREALAALRRLALQKFTRPMHQALELYLKENGGQFPTDPRLLAGYFDPEVPIEMLSNFEVGEDKTTRSFDANGAPVPQAPRLAVSSKIVDDVYDTRVSLFAGWMTTSSVVNLSQTAITEAMKQYRAVNNGQVPKEPGQLTPFLKSTVDPEFLRNYVAQLGKPRS